MHTPREGQGGTCPVAPRWQCPQHIWGVLAVGAGQVARSPSLKPSLIVRLLIACHEPDSDFVLRLFFPGICCSSADVRWQIRSWLK